jgi:hypothetical protein
VAEDADGIRTVRVLAETKGGDGMTEDEREYLKPSSIRLKTYLWLELLANDVDVAGDPILTEFILDCMDKLWYMLDAKDCVYLNSRDGTDG